MNTDNTDTRLRNANRLAPRGATFAASKSAFMFIRGFILQFRCGLAANEQLEYDAMKKFRLEKNDKLSIISAENGDTLSAQKKSERANRWRSLEAFADFTLPCSCFRN